MDILKVSGKTEVAKLAGAIAGCIRDNGSAELQAVGASSINVAVKAIAVARGYCAPQGIDLVCVPAFADIMIDGEEKTAIRFIVS